jgi:hypothetical protein
MAGENYRNGLRELSMGPRFRGDDEVPLFKYYGFGY